MTPAVEENMPNFISDVKISVHKYLKFRQKIDINFSDSVLRSDQKIKHVSRLFPMHL